MRLQSKFLALLLPAGLASAGAILFMIRRSVHAVILDDLTKRVTSVAEAAASDAQPGFEADSEILLLPVLQSVQKRAGAFYAAAVDGGGRVLAHTSITLKGRLEPGPAADSPASRLSAVRGEPALEIAVPVWSAPGAAAGESFLLTGIPAAAARIRLGTLKVAVPLASARETEKRIVRDIFLIVCAIGGGALFLVLFLVRGILSPIQGLMAGIARIKRGQYGVAVPLLSKDELGDLALSFNSMSREIVRTTVSKEYLQGILENMLDPLVVTDTAGTIETINPAALAILRAPADELIGQPLSALFHEGETLFPAAEFPARALSGGVRDLETALKTPSGSGVPALFSASALRDRDGRVRGYVGVAKDMTERKRIEDALMFAKTAAETSSRELEAFSYSVAHDLRAPLRAIDGFSLALLEAYNDKLDDEGRDYLARVRAGSSRMGLLIDDLLRLSQVSRSAMRTSEFDLSVLARDVAAVLKAAHPERDVVFRIAEKVRANGDPSLLRAALENLFGNAWKYTNRHPRATIEFGETVHEGERVFFVRDDGAGFDMAFAKKLFQPFSRLHSAREFEGTGIGLATVQRIVARHGGRIWGESEVEKGAAFYFTLSGAQS